MDECCEDVDRFTDRGGLLCRYPGTSVAGLDPGAETHRKREQNFGSSSSERRNPTGGWIGAEDPPQTVRLIVSG